MRVLGAELQSAPRMGPLSSGEVLLHSRAWSMHWCTGVHRRVWAVKGLHRGPRPGGVCH